MKFKKPNPSLRGKLNYGKVSKRSAAQRNALRKAQKIAAARRKRK